MTNIKNKIESILYVSGEAIAPKKMAKVLALPEETVVSALKELKEDYTGRGLIIIENGGEWQIGTNPENSAIIEELVKSEFNEDLTRATLETLTIIAYKGPTTRSKIEFIRGVNSSFTVRNLLLRGLIERIDNPSDSRSYLYRVSFDFLKFLGLSSVSELPSYAEFQKKADEILNTVSLDSSGEPEPGTGSKIAKKENIKKTDDNSDGSPLE
ncbi:MAG: SMC-Scp complex subunit ScpB [Candidatus Sungbacteria bacterium]|nr:SMC-Scp complex subunit ScpB [Candidatus Sungbacteria bacterium]